ncbi:MAG: hypothetical protein ACI8RD_011480 [Bacillariaceae sp.]|jgi:hypothetical protein
MSEEEWETSFHQEKSLLLMFNIALSNHLLGMKLLSLGLQEQEKEQEQQHQQLTSLLSMAQQSFHTAKTYYRLALLENCNTNVVYVLDKFTYPAMINNMSHGM